MTDCMRSPDCTYFLHSKRLHRLRRRVPNCSQEAARSRARTSFWRQLMNSRNLYPCMNNSKSRCRSTNPRSNRVLAPMDSNDPSRGRIGPTMLPRQQQRTRASGTCRRSHSMACGDRCSMNHCSRGNLDCNHCQQQCTRRTGLHCMWYRNSRIAENQTRRGC